MKTCIMYTTRNANCPVVIETKSLLFEASAQFRESFYKLKVTISSKCLERSLSTILRVIFAPTLQIEFRTKSLCEA
jgi:hypothetical protein